jgi:hypothetical protein
LTNNENETPDNSSTRLSNSKASSSTGSEVPPDPTSDELKVETVEIDDEQTIADQTLKNEEHVEETSSSSDDEDRLV